MSDEMMKLLTKGDDIMIVVLCVFCKKISYVR